MPRKSIYTPTSEINPEVAQYKPFDTVWVLSTKHGRNPKTYRYSGIVKRPLIKKVLVTWQDATGLTFIQAIKPERLERRKG